MSGTMASCNDAVIEQFRANDDVLEGHGEGKKTLLLHRSRIESP
jgi:hypothetical protein